ncbi:MAG: hypothetical protein J0L84_15885, partial [Verrucomicrobia bacterium]|nr:hypothetical protein [Verrucomicrobiota bacterium]
VHFILQPQDLGPEASMTVNADLYNGGSVIRNVIQQGFFRHDIVVRFRNGRGETSVVYANQITRNTTLEVKFSLESVGATVGANTVEFVRAGPNADRTGAWVLFDQARLEIRNPKAPVSPSPTPTPDPAPTEPAPDSEDPGEDVPEEPVTQEPRSLVWKLGVNDNKDREFTSDQQGNGGAPGRATRAPEDPSFDAANNPPVDDDFYFAGRYPAGFNGLSEDLELSLPEPDSAWERALSMADPTNRMHFVLEEADLGPEARMTLRTILFRGSSKIGNDVQPGPYVHDVVIRFRNGRGEATEVYSKRVTLWEPIALEFPLTSVGATEGPNTLEFVRTGPDAERTEAWITFDYIELHSKNSPAATTPSENPEPQPPPSDTPPVQDPAPTPAPVVSDPAPADPPFPESSPTDPTPEGGTTPATPVTSG